MENENKELSPEEKKIELYLSQKKLLDTFLSSGAISKEQYQKSLCGLTEKMGMEAFLKSEKP